VLAAAWDSLVEAGSDGRRRIGAAARDRIVDLYDLSVITARYEALYEGLLADAAPASLSVYARPTGSR